MSIIMPSKIIFTLLVEQALVIIILLIHLKGFMNVYHTPVQRNITIFKANKIE